MAVPHSLSRKLRETLGQDAGGDLVTWLDEEREDRTRIHAELAELRHEMLAMEGRLGSRIHEVKSDLMKWSFVFWCGAVAAIAALAGVLRL
jgi:hypothetical protein